MRDLTDKQKLARLIRAQHQKGNHVGTGGIPDCPLCITGQNKPCGCPGDLAPGVHLASCIPSIQKDVLTDEEHEQEFNV